MLTVDGRVNVSTLQATYQGASAVFSVDAQLLFAGMKLLQPGASDQDALVWMTQIVVNSVDAAGAIHFTAGAMKYKVYRDTEGTVKLTIDFESFNLPVYKESQPSASPAAGLEDDAKQPASTSADSLVLPALRFGNLYGYFGFSKQNYSGFSERFVASANLFSGSNVSAPLYQQGSTLKSSPVFGFESNMLFGEILRSLIG
jgi:hypothetical protein